MKTLQEKGGTHGTIKNRENLNSKQLRAISLLQKKVENEQKVNLGEILIESGYSQNTAKTPKKVFGKAAVRQEMQVRGLTPDGLQKIHEELMNAYVLKVYSYPIQVPQESIIETYETYLKGTFVDVHEHGDTRYYQFLVPDSNARAHALKLGYKIYPPKRFVDQDAIKRSNTKRLEKIRELSKKQKKLIRLINTELENI